MLLFTGGVLVCSTNSLLYLNQSVPPYGVSLNSIAEQSTAFPLRKYNKLYSITFMQYSKSKHCSNNQGNSKKNVLIQFTQEKCFSMNQEDKQYFSIDWS